MRGNNQKNDVCDEEIQSNDGAINKNDIFYKGIIKKTTFPIRKIETNDTWNCSERFDPKRLAKWRHNENEIHEKQ